jgi:hypothetical protein
MQHKVLKRIELNTIEHRRPRGSALQGREGDTQLVFNRPKGRKIWPVFGNERAWAPRSIQLGLFTGTALVLGRSRLIQDLTGDKPKSHNVSGRFTALPRGVNMAELQLVTDDTVQEMLSISRSTLWRLRQRGLHYTLTSSY